MFIFVYDFCIFVFLSFLGANIQKRIPKNAPKNDKIKNTKIIKKTFQTIQKKQKTNTEHIFLHKHDEQIMLVFMNKQLLLKKKT